MQASDPSTRVDWLVFGDDWGRHPSTTQHLVRALPPEDRVLWVGSLGMRAPRPVLADARRIVERIGSIRRPAREVPDRMRVLAPRVAPFHRHPVVRAANRASLRAQVREALARAGMRRPVALVAAPVAALYLDGLPIERSIYLRLDDHPRLPGVDPVLAREAEAQLVAHADACVATARSLAMPGRTWTHLPQAVDTAHFGQASLEIPEPRVLGFFGALAPWLDVALIERVARLCPGWTLELVGPVIGGGVALPALPNVRVRPPVPYAELPALLSGWRASWIPFALTELTRGVDPLKARESLAAGLPTLATPLPALAAVPEIELVRDAEDVVRALASVLQTDTPARRAARRASVAGETWAARAALLRDIARGTT
jgi:hypothetical protein